MTKYSKKTQSVHSGTIEDAIHKGTVSPIYPATAYDYIDVDTFAYPRYFNTPNQKAVSDKIRDLENGEMGIIFGSGMAAITTVLFNLLKQGDHAVFQNDLYGGTYHAITTEMKKFGINYSLTSGLGVEQFEKLITSATKVIYIETPSNPLLKIVDVRAIAQLAKAHNIITVIDNTFASPINQNPIDLGIDVVIHSATKYLSGHSDISAGAVVTSKELGDSIARTALNFGGSLNPLMCYLLERSIKTLALRVHQQNDSAMQIARFLSDHPKAGVVYYPGLEDHPQHELAKSQMLGFGGMLSFEAKTNPNQFVKNLNLIPSAMSLAGVESTITSPVQTSHSKMDPEMRKKNGITDQLLRLSVGIEDVNDLIADLDQALSK